MTVQKLVKSHGYWGEHAFWKLKDWQHEVANGDTRDGYWVWVAVRIEIAIERYSEDTTMRMR